MMELLLQVLKLIQRQAPMLELLYLLKIRMLELLLLIQPLLSQMQRLPLLLQMQVLLWSLLRMQESWIQNQIQGLLQELWHQRQKPVSM